MSQKILASHGDDDGPNCLIEVKVDQVVLAREPHRILASAVKSGLTKSVVEVSVAYPAYCIPTRQEESDPHSLDRIPKEAVALGFLVAQRGAGFAPPVHLERFASPARLLLTDEPRLSSAGAMGMLALPASRSQLVQALREGITSVRPARSVQVLLSGRIRPFVSVRDVALELLRLGVADVIRAVDARYAAPVVLEFGGPSCKFLSVGDRSVLCAMAPQLGAASALFAADEKTETYLRNQRRSKAHRALSADSGAPWDDVVSLDLAAVDPLVRDENGNVRPVRELEGRRIDQILLGGDSGVSLRDFFAVAALLKSKRVAPGLDFLLCPPSRQMLEVMTQGPLLDLIATGARLIEPDKRVLTGEFYTPESDASFLKNCDHRSKACGMIASPETLAFAAFNGELADPRNFKRPVRVTVPNNLPTDDVLLSRGREAKGGAKGKGRVDKRVEEGSELPPPSGELADAYVLRNWSGAVELEVATDTASLPGMCAFVAESLDDVRWLTENATLRTEVRAVIAEHIPAATVSMLSGLGVLALRADRKTMTRVGEAKSLRIPHHESWMEGTVPLRIGEEEVNVDWLAIGEERNWASGD
jgi:aconitate hydratase